MIWRDRFFGPPGRGKAGTIVRVKAPGSNRTPAYLKSMGRPTHLFYDTGYGICADFEVVTPRVPLEDFAPSRLWLPYGYWTLKDGSTVTFARDYKPLWHVTDGGITRLDPWLWIRGIEKENPFPDAGRYDRLVTRSRPDAGARSSCAEPVVRIAAGCSTQCPICSLPTSTRFPGP
ncbi:hypothetical protein F1643_14275 [Azospirillum sp. INR13]|uniref:hypothetical protein n=1 Tax=Azospirillum sp. INR13 TaxID=2596919 RepID=UPI001892865A|nr:hypothetical protein [Azospirillum sp. INR13]MBF5095419.1 hypothetical protein [Azospirillum sp. INR13]